MGQGSSGTFVGEDAKTQGALLLTISVAVSVAMGMPLGLAHGTSSSPLPGPASAATFAEGALPGGVPRAPANSAEEVGGPLVPASNWTDLTAGEPTQPTGLLYSLMAYDAADGYEVLLGTRFRDGATSGTSTYETWIFSADRWQNISATAGAPNPNGTPGNSESMAYDAADGYVLAIGLGSGGTCNGVGNGSCVWTFSAGHWTQVLPSCLPKPCSGPLIGGDDSMTYDAATDSVLLLGTNLNSECGSEVGTSGRCAWSYRGGVWTLLVDSNTDSALPPGLNSESMAYDPALRVVVLFGGRWWGESGSGYENYTWEFADGNWTNATSSLGASPSARDVPDLAFDSASDVLLLFGGAEAPYGYSLNDTWELSDAGWVYIPTAVTPPPSSAGAMADDPADGGVLLCGADTAYEPVESTWLWSSSVFLGGLSPRANTTEPSPGAAVSFDEAFFGGRAPFNFSWRFSDGGASSLPDPVHVFVQQGYYNVTLWVNDSTGQSVEGTLEIHAYLQLEVPIVSASPNPALFGQPIIFRVNDSGGTRPYTYAWNFGDGGTGGDLENITHAFTTDGPFTVTVTLTDALGVVRTTSLNISILLQVSLSASTTLLHVGGSATLDPVVSGGAPPYLVTWPNQPSWCSPVPSSDEVGVELSCTPTEVGAFPIEVQVEDSAGHSAVDTITLQVEGSGSQRPESKGPPATDLDAGLVVALAAALTAALVLAGRWRKQGRGPAPPPLAAGPYAKFFQPPESKGKEWTPLSEGETDPASDLY